MITIEIVFAAKNTLWQHTLSVPAHSTAQDALQSSGLYDAHPEAIGLAMGLFGELCQSQTELRNGDRLEVYRDLVFDPSRDAVVPRIVVKPKVKAKLAANPVLQRV